MPLRWPLNPNQYVSSLNNDNHKPYTQTHHNRDEPIIRISRYHHHRDLFLETLRCAVLRRSMDTTHGPRRNYQFSRIIKCTHPNQTRYSILKTIYVDPRDSAGVYIDRGEGPALNSSHILVGFGSDSNQRLLLVKTTRPWSLWRCIKNEITSYKCIGSRCALYFVSYKLSRKCGSSIYTKSLRPPFLPLYMSKRQRRDASSFC